MFFTLFFGKHFRDWSISLGISSSKDLSIAMLVTTKLSDDLLGSRVRWMCLCKIPSTESPEVFLILGFLTLDSSTYWFLPCTHKKTASRETRSIFSKFTSRRTRRCHLILNRRDTINISTNNKHQSGCGAKGILCWWGCELMEDGMGVSLKSKNKTTQKRSTNIAY